MNNKTEQQWGSYRLQILGYVVIVCIKTATPSGVIFFLLTFQSRILISIQNILDSR